MFNAAGPGLLDAGLRHGDVVALMIGNSWQVVMSFFGCSKIG